MTLWLHLIDCFKDVIPYTTVSVQYSVCLIMILTIEISQMQFILVSKWA